jgi:ABC-type nickel/cobalt efflux system permease component RcnA
MTVDPRWLQWLAEAAVLVLLIAAWWLWSKGRAFARGDVFKASRLSRGNHLFPTQVLITPSSVVQYTPHWIGRHEETIHMAHVSSVRIDTGMLFSNLFIETSGGSDPIRCYGHGKGDAARMKDLIEKYQTEYYRAAAAPTAPVPERSAGGG